MSSDYDPLVFKQVTEGLDFRDTGPQRLESFSDFKDILLTCLDDHLQWVDIDISNPDDYLAACQVLTDWINKDAAQLDGLDFGDEVVSTGELVYLELSHKTHLVDTMVLDEQAILRGGVRCFVVSDGPRYDVLRDPKVYRDEENPAPLKHFSLSMLLRSDVTLIHPTGHIEALPHDRSISIPFDNVDLAMSKVL